MSIKDIPAERIITCDCCGSASNGVGATWKKAARIIIGRHGLDMLGDPACDATVTLDLCDDCETTLSKSLNETMEEVRRART